MRDSGGEWPVRGDRINCSAPLRLLEYGDWRSAHHHHAIPIGATLCGLAGYRVLPVCGLGVDGA